MRWNTNTHRHTHNHAKTDAHNQTRTGTDIHTRSHAHKQTRKRQTHEKTNKQAHTDRHTHTYTHKNINPTLIQSGESIWSLSLSVRLWWWVMILWMTWEELSAVVWEVFRSEPVNTGQCVVIHAHTCVNLYSCVTQSLNKLNCEMKFCQALMWPPGCATALDFIKLSNDFISFEVFLQSHSLSPVLVPPLPLPDERSLSVW